MTISTRPVPKLITFDGEARSGKGTIVSAVKDALRDNLGYNVMLIDAGQVFRCLVVACMKDGVDIDDPAAIDSFLADDEKAEECVSFVKRVYRMSKAERDDLLYTNEVSVGSAKIGARPLSQAFKDELLKKWLRDAHEEGFDIVLLDGRALEETGMMLEHEKLCDFTTGLYFVCDPIVGARRTLGFAATPYDELLEADKSSVDELSQQIITRNKADQYREVQPIVKPDGPLISLPIIPVIERSKNRFMATIDTSAEMTKSAMCHPIIEIVSQSLK